jgi:hypothetical protein
MWLTPCSSCCGMSTAARARGESDPLTVAAVAGREHRSSKRHQVASDRFAPAHKVLCSATFTSSVDL